MNCKDCKYITLHFPDSGMHTDGFVCCRPDKSELMEFVELFDNCHWDVYEQKVDSK